MAKNEYICDCNVIHQDVVDKVLNNFPSNDTFLTLAKLYKILGDSTRCKIVYTLKDNDMCVCDIANVLSMSKSAISHQLATLKKANIVKNKKIGKEVFYMLDDEHVVELFNMGLIHINHER